MQDFFRELFSLLNETLASAIVVVSVSLLLYNLSRNLNNRVARSSGAVLSCVTLAYVCDVLLTLNPGLNTAEALLRIQFIGVALVPAATYHLSDALLATTGLPSRGRRRRAVRFLYIVGIVFMVMSAFTDLLLTIEIVGDMVSLRAEPGLAVFLLYFLPVIMLSFVNVGRARRRCLTRSTERRMAYLQSTILMPPVAIFPYSVLLPAGEEFSVGALFIVNIANLLVVLALLFLSYPLSFFGSKIPDRVVKADLLRFMLLGPGTGLLALVVIIFTVPASELIGIPGAEFMPFGVVAVILLWQWLVDIFLPTLERRLIYDDEDDEQLARIEALSERLLTRSDLLQLLEATLEATCDYLRLNGAFVAMISDDQPEMVQSIGQISVTNQVLQEETLPLLDRLRSNDEAVIQQWRDYWVLPLYSGRNTDANGNSTMIGMMGVEARVGAIDLNPEDERQTLLTFAQRAARTLDDMLLQGEIYAALTGLLPQIAITRGRAAEVEFRPGHDGKPVMTATVLDREQVIEQVRAALKDYWGGTGLSSSRLLELVTVRSRLAEHDNNPIRALRAALQAAIEIQRPAGERDMKSPEWTLYNILDLRFIENRKVKDTARRLYVSEANLYRKQNVAIEAVTDTLIKMEQQALSQQQRGVLQFPVK